MAMIVIAAYDVTHNDRRARLAAVLQAYGDRIQKSVFILQIDDDELASIVCKAEEILDLDSDSVWFARQCANCWKELIALGQTAKPDKLLYWVV
ncbi:MAG: CRISPR-associated endonuclease Cas2 [Actinomycetaceae bacterium]|nr:CRISPR-associated endonuclease Cas2 [Actinomycetaceae bacterium]